MFTLVCQGQSDRYMVFLSDKNGSDFSLERPDEFLSQKSINRRLNQGIEVNATDLPVNTSYINQIEQLGVEVFYASKWMNAILVQTDSERIDQLEALNFVDSIEFVAPGERLIPSGNQGGRINLFGNRKKEGSETVAQNGLLDIDEMHNQNFIGQGIMIAVFDGGFQAVDESRFFSHLFTDDQLVNTRDFVTNSDNVYQFDDHGTRVFSTIAAFVASEFSGTAYEADFILCVTEDVSSEYRVEEYNWLFAAEYADSLGVDIISTSLGYNLFDDSSMNYDLEDLDGETAVITRAHNMASEKGIFLVASAGNEGNNSWQKVTPPADSPNVLSVGSINSQGNISSFSSIGPTIDDRIKPDVVALGSGVTVIGGNGEILTSNGTSFSAPLVTGLVAGVWQANPTFTNMELLEAIRLSGNNSSNPDNVIGYGLPRFGDAVSNPVLSIDEIIRSEITVYPNPFSGSRIFVDVGDRSSDIYLELFSLTGQTIKRQSYSGSSRDNVVVFEFDSNLDAGTYILRVNMLEESIEVRLLKN